MTGDLLQSRILNGKSRAEVLDLLGPPDGVTRKLWKYDFVHGSLFGMATGDVGFFNWTEYVQIEFEKNTDLVLEVEMND